MSPKYELFLGFDNGYFNLNQKMEIFSRIFRLTLVKWKFYALIFKVFQKIPYYKGLENENKKY